MDAGTGATRVGAVATAQRVGFATPNADADADDASKPAPLRTESRRRPQPCSDTLTPTATEPGPTDAAVDGTALSALPDQPAATSRSVTLPKRSSKRDPSAKVREFPEHASDAGSCEQNLAATP